MKASLPLASFYSISSLGDLDITTDDGYGAYSGDIKKKKEMSAAIHFGPNRCWFLFPYRVEFHIPQVFF